MAPPKGSQYALGHGFGRPETWTEEKIYEEAKAFVEWAQQDDALAWEKFACIRGYSPRYLYRWKESNDNFCQAAEFAKALIGARREEMCMDKAYGRWASWYSPELKKHEQDLLAYQKSLEQKQPTQERELHVHIHDKFPEQKASSQ